MLDVGCGWGGAADRLQTVHGAAAVVGLTPSPGQAALAASRVGAGVTIREESWSDHEPDAPYDAIVCIEASEHFARDGLAVEDKVAAYRAFFGRAASWLRPGGRLGLQAICLDNAGHQESLSGGGADQRPDPLGDLPGVDVLVALGAGPRLGDRLPTGVLPRRAGALRPHLPGLELGAPRRRRSSRGAGRPRGPPALRPLLRRQSRPVPAPAADPLPDRPVAPARAEALGLAARSGGGGRVGPAPTPAPATAPGTSAPAIRRTTTCRTTSTPCGSALRCRTRRACGPRAPLTTAPRRPRRSPTSPPGSASPAGASWTWGAVGPRSCARWSSSTASPRASV